MTNGTCSADDCNRPAELRGLCRRDYKRARKAGTLPNITRANGGAAAIIAQGVAATGDGPCIYLQTAGNTRPNYLLNGACTSASRAVWIVANGDPGSAWVLHTCGQGQQGCVRLGHLYLGDAQQNADDCTADGNRLTGTRHPNATLTDDDIRAIRATPKAPPGRRPAGATYVTSDQLARKYGISRGAVSAIQNGRGWDHVK